MPRRTGSALLLALSLALPAAAAEVEFSASADADQVAMDGTLRLRISAAYSSKGETGQLQLPPFSDFDVVGKDSSEQVTVVFASGAPSFKRTVVTQITLTPKRTGELTIEPARLEYQGKTYRTQPIRIRALPAGQAPAASARPPDDRPDDLDPFADVHPGRRDLLVRASIDNDHPYVGQQVTYSLFLLSRVNVSSIEKLQLPRLDGFWSEDLETPQQLVPEPRTIDGVQYTAYLLRRRALFPLRPGKAVIEPAEVGLLTGFGMLFSRGSSRRASQPVELEVQPLPEGKPPGFDPGNVGDWTLTATVEPVNVAVGQPVTFRLVASGRGNVRDLRLPRLGAIAGLRAYDATSSDKESIDRGQVTGTRTMEQLLVPERTGPVEIPALSMDIFDPAQKAYRTLRTDPVTLRVAPAAQGQAAAEPVAQNLLSSGGVRPIRLRLETASAGAAPWAQPWFWPVLGLPPFGLALLLGFSRMRRIFATDPDLERVRKARSAAARRLRGAQALLARGEAAAFYAEIARAVTGYLADKQGVVSAGLTREELARALSSRGHGEETVRRLVRLLDDCDRMRFAPGSGEAPAREAMLGRADQVLSELDRPGA
ncbi:MAG TPA: BatD family protein [Myxococcales bacterium]